MTAISGLSSSLGEEEKVRLRERETIFYKQKSRLETTNDAEAILEQVGGIIRTPLNVVTFWMVRPFF